MSHSPFTSFSVFLKKFTGKGSLRRRLTKKTTRTQARPLTVVPPSKSNAPEDLASVSTCSLSLHQDEKRLSMPVIVSEKSALDNEIKHATPSPATSPVPSATQNQPQHEDDDTIEAVHGDDKQQSSRASSIDIALADERAATPTTGTENIEKASNNENREMEQDDDDNDEQQPSISTSTSHSASSMDLDDQEPPVASSTTPVALETDAPLILIRDFAYDESSPLHRGIPDVKHTSSVISLSSTRFNGCQGRALFDFEPESEHEIPMKAGQTIWIQYRQCEGWLIADVDEETGLVPESYVERL